MTPTHTELTKAIELKFMVVPEQLAAMAYVPNAVRIKIIDPEAIFLLGIIGESGRKLVEHGIEFYFERSLAEKLIANGVAENSLKAQQSQTTNEEPMTELQEQLANALQGNPPDIKYRQQTTSPELEWAIARLDKVYKARYSYEDAWHLVKNTARQAAKNYDVWLQQKLKTDELQSQLAQCKSELEITIEDSNRSRQIIYEMSAALQPNEGEHNIDCAKRIAVRLQQLEAQLTKQSNELLCETKQRQHEAYIKELEAVRSAFAAYQKLINTQPTQPNGPTNPTT